MPGQQAGQLEVLVVLIDEQAGEDGVTASQDVMKPRRVDVFDLPVAVHRKESPLGFTKVPAGNPGALLDGDLQQETLCIAFHRFGGINGGVGQGKCQQEHDAGCTGQQGGSLNFTPAPQLFGRENKQYRRQHMTPAEGADDGKGLVGDLHRQQRQVERGHEQGQSEQEHEQGPATAIAIQPARPAETQLPDHQGKDRHQRKEVEGPLGGGHAEQQQGAHCPDEQEQAGGAPLFLPDGLPAPIEHEGQPGQGIFCDSYKVEEVFAGLDVAQFGGAACQPAHLILPEPQLPERFPLGMLPQGQQPACNGHDEQQAHAEVLHHETASLVSGKMTPECRDEQRQPAEEEGDGADGPLDQKTEGETEPCAPEHP